MSTLDAPGSKVLWLGLCNIDPHGEFKQRGGTQISPMSVSENRKVAEHHALRRKAEGGEETRRGGQLTLLKMAANVVPSSPRGHIGGSELTYLSVFPEEAEHLYPPCTYLEPRSATEEEVMLDGTKVTFNVLEVIPRSSA